MTTQPLVSICVPTYNRAGALQDGLQDLRRQDYPRLEILISDNASTDATPQVCRDAAAEDPRIRVVRQPTNLGLYGNHNFCLEASRGEFLALFHDHDEHDPTLISLAVAFLQSHPEVGAVGSDWELIDEAGRRLGVREHAVPAVTPGLAFIDRTIRSARCSLGIPGAVIRRSALGEVRFDERGPIGFGDFPVWFRLAERSSIGHLSRRLWRWRQVLGSQSACTIDTMVRDYEAALTAYCDAHLARWPDHGALVAHWRRAIRRYIFWALAFELGLQHRRQPTNGLRRGATLFELRGYRLESEARSRVLERLRAYRTGPVEVLAAAAIAGLIRCRMPGLFAWVTSHSLVFRRLLRLQ